MLERGHYHDGRLIVIAPALNAECQAAIARYRAELVSDDPGETRFQAVTLEDLTSRCRCRGRRYHRGTGDRALPRLRAGPSRSGRHLPAGRGHRLSRQPRRAPTQCQPTPRPGRGRYLAADRTRPCGQDRHRLGLCDLGLGCPGLGRASLSKLAAVRGRLSLAADRDRHFRADKPLSAYAEAAQANGAIAT